MKIHVQALAPIFAAAALLSAPSVLIAQTYPTKPVRVMIPWPPGGSNDVVGRVVFQKMTQNLGRQFVIENRGGAAGTIGAGLFAKTKPDGYNVMVHSATHVANAHLYKKLRYDTLKDFIGVTPLARQVGMLVVYASVPAKSVKELIALAKKRPGEIVYASSGSGSFVHLTMALFNSVTDTRMVHVPYKGGGPAGIAIASGEVQTMIATIASLVPHLNAKRVRPLGVTSEKRVTQFPDVPAIAESVPGYEFTAWVGVFVPVRTPRPIVDKLNAELKKALDAPEVSKILNSQTLDPMYMTPEQFAQHLQSDYEKYGKMIKASGAKLE